MTTTTKLSRKEQFVRDALDKGLQVRTYSPGDGVTRYRFFTDPENGYFGPDNGIYTALGLTEARTFLAGYTAR